MSGFLEKLSNQDLNVLLFFYPGEKVLKSREKKLRDESVPYF